MRTFLFVLLVSCRTQPLVERDMKPAASTADLSVAADLSSMAGEGVSCGGGATCSIAAGEHCCEDATLHCSTGACGYHEYDCDGPEDCPGGEVCCFPGDRAACRAGCAPTGVVLCHAASDCPAGQVCCLGFVLGAGDGMCLGACD